MNCALSMERSRELQRDRLRAHAISHPNSELLAEIISSWQCGIGVLPEWLGLGEEQFDQLHQFYFGGETSIRACPWSRNLDHRLDDLRQDLLKLLLINARDHSDEVRWVAELIATACQGSNHLWEDLGVWNRASLSQLLDHNFPELAARNSRDMKWKKFLFKQLCETEGLYICRAPTCDECADFDECFGPE
ncbi:nitrogen fixation protein NifQ [Motiliproteus sediminis]|uniref:nitrogen fixation protein NifQ n=1 Tax=Motiliproteus sediminis TaxID=1468178 RepID=UPI001AEFA731|nr:nitrogen fixation protein NifQ [Motiliproteus sediminis]